MIDRGPDDCDVWEESYNKGEDDSNTGWFAVETANIPERVVLVTKHKGVAKRKKE